MANKEPKDSIEKLEKTEEEKQRELEAKKWFTETQPWEEDLMSFLEEEEKKEKKTFKLWGKK